MPALLVMRAACGAIAPLSSEERVRLSTAHDGRDHQEEAFVALLENAARSTPGPADEPIRLAPDIDALIAAPEPHRGDLCRVRGVLQQRTGLAPPHERASEWFVRDGAGRPLLVYVAPGAGAAGLEDVEFREGDAVEIDARFYKRVDAQARDGEVRTYAAFVGAHPRRQAGASAGTAPSSVLALGGLVLAGFVLLVFLLVIGRRMRTRSLLRALAIDEPPPPEAPLPEDPVEALGELRRRASADGGAS